MKTKTKKAPTHKQQPVEVVIAVTRFVDALAPNPAPANCGIEFTMKLRRQDPRAHVEGDNLYMRRPGGPIRFTITASAGEPERYYPTGITFLRESPRNKGDSERLGLLNFPQSHHRFEGRALWIKDLYRDTARRVRYKFSLLVQRGSDGKIGIIDPGIIHEDE